MRCRAIHRPSRSQAPEHAEPPGRACIHEPFAVVAEQWLGAQRKDDIERSTDFEAVEPCGSDADNLDRPRTKDDGSSDRGDLRRVCAAPEVIAEDRPGCATRSIVFGG